MPLQATSGAASYDAFGGGVAAVPQYIEDVFSTWLYTGTGSAQTITNGVDLSTKGGLVWVKNRSSAVQHFLFDTSRGMGFATQSPFLSSNLTDAQTDAGTNYIRADTTGFSYGSGASGSGVNAAPNTYASWTFRKQPKFFDVVTYTGNGDVNNVPHNLGSVPGCIIIKRTSGVSAWAVWHRYAGVTNQDISGLSLNTTAAAVGYPNNGSTYMTSTTFEPNYIYGATGSSLNTTGESYVAYLFAHNAGGFGLTGTDNVITCGSYTTDASAVASVTLGYEPQWLLIKRTDAGGFNWEIRDVMRGYSMTGAQALAPNSSAAEYDSTGALFYPTATGFVDNGSQAANATFIYIAIRRGPMKVPTDATKVFKPVSQNGAGTVTTGFPVSLVIAQKPDGAGANWQDRLRGGSTNSYNVLYSYSTNAEASGTGAGYGFDNNTGYVDAFSSSAPRAYWNFQRAPSFFDEVCYTGTGSATTFSHNLGVVPELIFIKCRSAANGGLVYNKTIGASKYLELFFTSEGNYAAQGPDSGPFNSTEPTSSVFSVGTYSNTNGAGATYVAYLFATCAGVSKVGSYTGNGSTQTIDCGFGAGGARFVLIKRTDSTGDWYTYDTARGMTVLTDPYLLLNSTAAETATLGSVTTVSTGFALNSSILAAINVSGGSYIFFAVA